MAEKCECVVIYVLSMYIAVQQYNFQCNILIYMLTIKTCEVVSFEFNICEI